ncbi:MAG: InlB B-repeat-containing protein [Lactobacillaceae bacterium]|jgi:uncharacterized repeat protein (TIGR02543 family)|nr:InlB B-repeat-containing protein [Lactobacillaceae bacterium]
MKKYITHKAYRKWVYLVVGLLLLVGGVAIPFGNAMIRDHQTSLVADDSKVTITCMNGTDIWKQETIEKDSVASLPQNPPAGQSASFMGWYTEPTDGEKFDFTKKVTTSVTLYAQFSAEYLVQFKDAQGKVIDSKTVKPDETVSATTKEVTPPVGEYFSYWYVQGDANKTPFVFADQKVGSDLVLVPAFSDGRTVLFVSDGSQVDPEYVKDGEKATKPADPTRQGYTFDHWSTSPNGSAYDFDTVITGGVTLYAVWTALEVDYEVVYWIEKPNIVDDPGTNDANYDYAWTSVQKAMAGSEHELDQASADAIKNADATGTKALLYSGFAFSNKKTVSGTGATKLNVYYKRTIYTQTFNLDGLHTTTLNINGTTYYGDGPAYSFQAKIGQNITSLWPTDVHSASQTFFGWLSPNLSTAGGALIYVTKRVDFNSDMLVTGSLNSVYTPYWTTIAGDDHLRYMFESLDGTGENYNGTYYKEDTSFSQDAANNGGSNWQAKAITGFDAANAVVVVNGNDVTFYYKRDTHDLMFDLNGGDFNGQATDIVTPYGKKINLPTPPTRDGYIFEGWFKDPDFKYPEHFTNLTMPDSDLTLYAEWGSTQNIVSYYDSLNGTLLEQQGYNTNDHVDLPEEYVKGQTFVEGKGIFNGWFWQVGNAGFEFTETIPVTRNIDLYAKWITSGYKITYDKGDGTGEALPDPDSYDLTTKAVIEDGTGLTPPTGEVFVGWRSNKSTEIFYPGNHMTVPGDVKMTAVYASTADLVNVTYHANYTDGPSPVTQLAIKDSSIMLKEAIFQRDGQDLIGWDTKADGTGTRYTLGQNDVKVENADVDLYAIWATRKVNVTFVAGTHGTLVYGDHGATTPIDYGTSWSDANITVPEPVADKGYEFAGWVKALPSADTIITSDKMFTAQFVKKASGTVTVRYVDDNGEQIAKDVVVTGDVGDKYDVSTSDYVKARIGDYELVKVPKNLTGEFAKTNTLVVYTYKSILPAGSGNVQVRYLDTEGREIENELIFTGKLGSTYDMTGTNKTVNGYHFVSTTGQLQGMFLNQPIIITHTYAKNVEDSGQVLIRYVDANGNTIRDSATVQGKIDADFNLNQYQVTINNYQFDHIIGNVDGKFTRELQTVTFVYNANQAGAATPVVPLTPITDGFVTEAGPGAPNPVTGDGPTTHNDLISSMPDNQEDADKAAADTLINKKQNELWLLILGVLAAAIIAWLLLLQRRKHWIKEIELDDENVMHYWVNGRTPVHYFEKYFEITLDENKKNNQETFMDYVLDNNSDFKPGSTIQIADLTITTTSENELKHFEATRQLKD